VRSTPKVDDRQALALLGAYLGVRAASMRVAIVALPWFLGHAAWSLPLLRPSVVPVVLASAGRRGSWGMLVAIGAGTMAMSMLGGLVMYWAGERFGVRVAERLAGTRWAWAWNRRQIERAHRWLERRGVTAVFLSRAAGALTGPVAIVAGASNMSRRAFFAALAAGSALWASLLVWLGVRSGDAWPWLPRRIESIATGAGRAWLVVAAATVLVGVPLAWRARARRRSPAEAEQL
jgi:membrane protein DedA with SNARE-associated domain